MGTGHGYQTCSVDRNCSICNKKHHLLLHFDTNSGNVRTSSNDAQFSCSEPTSNKSVAAHSSFNDDQVLLSTAIVYISDVFGGQHECKILLDSGSQSNFITKELCNKLKLPKETLNVPISGLGQICRNVSYGVRATIKSQFNNFKSDVSFLVIDHITENLPLNYIKFENIKIPQNIKLADPGCNVPSRIDALLGASIFWDLICIGQIKLSNSQIVAQKTKLGWILSGQTSNCRKNSQKLLCNFSTTRNIQNQLENFWKIEQCEPKPIWSLEQRACEEHFIATHSREDDGRFLINLPLRDGISKLGESRQIAVNRFYSLERKLQKNSELKIEYDRFLEEYEALGHMSEVNPENQPPLNYLPHHCVVKESSTTTKVRVVFDASAKTDSGSSLNDILVVGPVLQPELFSTILRFRKHKYVLTADCVKMYRQIKVRQEQRHLQAILWRSSPNEPLKSYTLYTVTYGTSSAPYLAVRCLYQLAEDNELKNPKGKFELRKWRSNNISISCNDNNAQENLEFSENKESKTLGLVWNSQDDIFQYNLQHINVTQKYVTKRTILSYISKIFDPLGLIGPIIIRAKIILQQLWQLSLDWDESVPIQIYSSWKTYQDQIQTLKIISVPRHVICSDPLRVEVHTFCDASETSYGVCIYVVRSLDSNGNFFTRLLCAKSRVAPLKTVSLPRLELCGALLAARLCNFAVKALDMPFDHLYYWCDSSVVLTWIRDEPYKWKTFVGNRVAEIQELSDKENWRHIRSGDNPADIISRGINPENLINSTLWWQGPQWLQYDYKQWPSSMPIKVSEVPERKNVSKVLVATEIDLSLFLKFSSFLRLQRVVAYIIRFKNNALKHSIETGPLKPHELEISLKCLVRLAQNQFFVDEIKWLSKNKPIGSKSKLFNLNPFMDTDHLLRVGGRLNRSNFEYDQRHPIILQKRHPLTKLIIAYEHRKLLHAGAQALLAHIRTRFWPIAGRDEVRRVLKACVICFKVKPINTDTLLGQLPSNRITPARPFLNCAVDYAGPFQTKVGLSRSRQLVKTYLCVFICLVTKAVHLELVVDLTTNTFLNAFKRFISRRGRCLNIYSDNGTTFVGANSELKDFLNLVENQNVFAEFFSTENITWHFIPPRSPHFGGLWESAVKAVKYHLRRIIGLASLTYEEFNTVIVQIEACLNSRPLCPLSTDPNDLNPLTPGHFLIGSSMLAIPEPDLKELNTNRLTRYQHLTQIIQNFWVRWTKDYVTELQTRSCRGSSTIKNLAPGAMVLLAEDNLPPLQWHIGRVQEVHPGADDVVRVATVKTAKGLFKRAVRKLCVLPDDD